MAIKVLKAVSLAVLRLVPGNVYHIKIVTPIKTGEKLDDKKEPAEICEVIDMETGEHRTLVTSTVLRKELLKQYPDNSYVGLFFQLSMSRRENKNYNDVTLVQIEDPTEHFEEERARLAKKAEADAAAAKKLRDEAAALERAAAKGKPTAPSK